MGDRKDLPRPKPAPAPTAAVQPTPAPGRKPAASGCAGCPEKGAAPPEIHLAGRAGAPAPDGLLGGVGLTHPTAAAARSGLARSLQRRVGNAAVQRRVVEKHRREPGQVTQVVEDAIAGSSVGQPIDPPQRSQLERFFNADLSHVRVHTGKEASWATQYLRADAFTHGQDVFFGEGQYQPESPKGQKLLAHELAHTLQHASISSVKTSLSERLTVSQPGDLQELEAESVARQLEPGMPHTARLAPARAPAIQRQVATPAPVTGISLPPPPPLGTSGGNAAPPSVDAAVNAILSDLKGPTPWWASERILNQFIGKDTAWIRAILQGLKNKAGDNSETPAGMIDWLFNDLTAEDARKLRQELIRAGVVEDLARIIAAFTLDRLKGFTSEADSAEIYTALAGFRGVQIEEVLTQLETMAGKNRPEMIEWLFGDMDRVNAERTRQLLFSGGPVSLEYSSSRTASLIYDLLSGYTSHADSSSIVWRFETTPLEYRIVVLQKLDVLTRAKRNQSAGNSLMEDMDRSDYEKLIDMKGLPLEPYVDKRSTVEKLVSGAEWAMVVVEWVACGLIGVITGILAVVWDLIVGLWDIVKAAWHLIWSLIYLLSGGTAGSENWLAVKDFFRGLEALGSPGKLWDDYWEGLKLEFKTIEGPLADCRMAEFIVRKFITAIVNIILIFVGGYGLAKGAVSAVKAVAEFAELARTVGILRALVQTAGKARQLLRLKAIETAAELARLSKLFTRPAELLVAIGKRINVILLAVREEGVWQFMRGKAGALVEGEKRWWQDQKDYWKARAEAKRSRAGELADETGQVSDALGENKAPENPDQVAKRLEDDANVLDEDVKDLEKDMKSEAPGRPDLTGDIERERGLIQSKLREEGVVRQVTDPELSKLYDVEITTGEHTYRRRPNGTWCRFSDGPICGIHLGPDIDNEVKKVLDKKLRRPSWQKSEADVGAYLDSQGPDWDPQVSFYEGKRVPPDKFGSVKPDYYHTADNIAVEVKNYDLVKDYDALVMILRDQAGGRLAYMPKGVRQWLFLDVRGQSIGDLAQMAARVRKSTGGVFERIHFLTDKGVVIP